MCSPLCGFLLGVATQIWLVSGLAFGNLALHKPVKQSSTYGNGGAANANDGIRDGDFSRGSCTLTSGPLPSPAKTWWAVNLEGVFEIKRVIIRNRDDAFAKRLRDFTIEVFHPDRSNWDNLDDSEHSICAYHEGVPKAIVMIKCAFKTIGQFVRITKLGKEPLTLCEVEVYGTVPARGTSKERLCRRTGVQSSNPVSHTMRARSNLHCAQQCTTQKTCTGFNVVPSGSDDTVCKLTTGLGRHEEYFGHGYMYYVFC